LNELVLCFSGEMASEVIQILLAMGDRSRGSQRAVFGQD
jgi:hypothetical protein